MLKRFQCPKCGWSEDKPLSESEVKDIFLGLKQGISVAEMAEIIGRTKQLVYAIRNRKFKKKWTENL